MTATQMEQKNNKGNGLNVFPAGNDNYMVESSQGKIFYKVFLNGSRTCTCADYVNNVQKDPGFLCKHIIAAIGLTTGNSGKKPVLDERFIIQIKRKEITKEFVLYAGLLDLAHQKGIKRMIVEAIQYPTKDNKLEAICRATVESKDGELFVEIADANPLNVNRMVVEHILRVSATRAKARALRDFTNIGMTCLEELGDIDDDIGEDKQKGRSRNNQQQKAEVRVDEKNQDPKAAQASEPKKAAANSTGAQDRDSRKEAPPTNHQPKPSPEAHPKDSEKNVKAKISDAQMTAIKRLKDIRSIPDDQLHEMFQKQFGIPFTEITGDEAKVFIRSLQQAA